MADEPGWDVLQTLVHDLRSPLMVVEGFATTLARDEGALTAEQRADYARRIADAAADLRTRVDQAAARVPK